MSMIRSRLVVTTLLVTTLLALVAVPTAVAQPEDRPDVEMRREAHLERLEQRLADAVEQGRISPERADEIRSRLEEGIARAEARRAERQTAIEALADVLGVTVDELRDARGEGRSLAEVAEANGVDVDDVIDHLVEQATERLDAAVESGRIDTDRAADLEARLRDRITAHVNGDGPDRPHPDGPRRGAGFGPHHHGRDGFGPHGTDAGD